MNFCQNCGKENERGLNFCRYCGSRFMLPQDRTSVNEQTKQSPLYLWKTDEYQVSNHSARTTQEIRHVQPLMPASVKAQQDHPLVYSQPGYFASGYRCPRCGTTNLPQTKRQISTGGWITFAVLLVLTVIFFWVGLLIKEDVQVCSVCGLKLSSH